MTSVDGGNERLVTVHDLGVGDTSNLVVTAAQECGYSVAATGLGQFRMIRQKRPMWAVVAAILTFPFLGIGLLFLLVKKTDSGSVAVFEGRDGTKARFVGAIDDMIIESVTSPTSRNAAGPAVLYRDDAITPERGDPFGSMPRASTASAAVPPESAGPVTTSPPFPVARAVPPEPELVTLIDSSPLTTPPGQLASTNDTDFEKTVARSSIRPTLETGAIIDLPDGRSISVSKGIVLGRSPRSPDGGPALQEVPYPDGSLSKTHLIIEQAGAGVMITDVHSTNGTTVVEGNSSRACPPGEPVAVAVGSDVRAGDVTIRIRTSR